MFFKPNRIRREILQKTTLLTPELPDPSPTPARGVPKWAKPAPLYIPACTDCENGTRIKIRPHRTGNALTQIGVTGAEAKKILEHHVQKHYPSVTPSTLPFHGAIIALRSRQ